MTTSDPAAPLRHDTRRRGSRPVHARRSGGVEASIMTYGAALQALLAPDRSGQPRERRPRIRDARRLRREPRHYFGATVGRYANRIAGARFALDGIVHEVDRNDGRELPPRRRARIRHARVGRRRGRGAECSGSRTRARTARWDSRGPRRQRRVPSRGRRAPHRLRSRDVRTHRREPHEPHVLEPRRRRKRLCRRARADAERLHVHAGRREPRSDRRDPSRRRDAAGLPRPDAHRRARLRLRPQRRRSTDTTSRSCPQRTCWSRRADGHSTC